LQNELDAVTKGSSGYEILISFDRLNYLYTSRSDSSLALLQRSEIKPLKIRTMMSSLSVAQREVVIKKYFRNMSERQIAKQLGITCMAVHFRLTQACEKMKKHLKFYYALCEG